MKERELKLTQQLMELQKRYNEMVKDRDRWKEKCGGLERSIDSLNEVLSESRRESRRLQRELDFYLNE